MAMAMFLHAINQAALVKSTDNSDNSCNMRAGVGANSFAIFIVKIANEFAPAFCVKSLIPEE
jgi:hypothetical protein